MIAMNNKKETLYKITFLNNGTTYELYAKSVYQSEIFGFVEIRDFIFGETSAIVADPSEEKLKTEFNQVNASLIPMHSIIRIDFVDKKGVSKITPSKNNEAGTIKPFPNIYELGVNPENRE